MPGKSKKGRSGTSTTSGNHRGTTGAVSVRKGKGRSGRGKRFSKSVAVGGQSAARPAGRAPEGRTTGGSMTGFPGANRVARRGSKASRSGRARQFGSVGSPALSLSEGRSNGNWGMLAGVGSAAVGAAAGAGANWIAGYGLNKAENLSLRSQVGWNAAINAVVALGTGWAAWRGKTLGNNVRLGLAAMAGTSLVHALVQGFNAATKTNADFAAAATAPRYPGAVWGADDYDMDVGAVDLASIADSSIDPLAGVRAAVAARIGELNMAASDFAASLASLGGQTFTDHQIAVLEGIEEDIVSLHTHTRAAENNLAAGRLEAADRFAAMAAQFGLEAQKALEAFGAGAATIDTVVEDITEDTGPAPEPVVEANIQPADEASVNNAVQSLTNAASNGGTGGYVALPFRQANGQAMIVGAPGFDAVTVGDFNIRYLEFDYVAAWAQDAANRVNAAMGTQPGMPGYTSASDMALAYVYWWDYYTRRKGYVFGVPQLVANTPGSWSSGTTGGASAPWRTKLAVNGQEFEVGGTLPELEGAVRQLYNGG